MFFEEEQTFYLSVKLITKIICAVNNVKNRILQFEWMKKFLVIVCHLQKDHILFLKDYPFSRFLLITSAKTSKNNNYGCKIII